MKTLTILLFPLLLHASSHDRAQKFFVDHYEAAEQLYFCDGIPIQLSLGVWALESGYGSSTAAQRNNLAGIASYKGGKHWKRFETKAEFYRAFAAIFQQPCYSNDLRPKSVNEYLEAMEWGCCSYHRSREYTHKIKWIIKRYKLESMKVTVNFINDNKTPIQEQKHHKKDFEKNVLSYLKNNPFSDLYILSDFYHSCCEFLELHQLTGDYKVNRRKIQFRLRRMKTKKLIDWRRTGTGFLGKTDTGVTSLNSYALHKEWNS